MYAITAASISLLRVPPYDEATETVTERVGDATIVVGVGGTVTRKSVVVPSVRGLGVVGVPAPSLVGLLVLAVAVDPVGPPAGLDDVTTADPVAEGLPEPPDVGPTEAPPVDSADAVVGSAVAGPVPAELLTDPDGVPGPSVDGAGPFDEQPATATESATSNPNPAPPGRRRAGARFVGRSIGAVPLLQPGRARDPTAVDAGK
jgi:hypothetical protein